jgi:Flp pilus assembly protein TadD
VIIVILAKKFPGLANIDVDQIPEERQASAKHLLIENRLRQKLVFIYEKIKVFFKPLENFLVNLFSNLRNKILALEKRHQQKKTFLIKQEPEEAKKRIQMLMAEGKELMQNNNLAEAEKKYIEVISLNEENISAYESLGNIYFQEKNYEHAKETFKHILKMLFSEKKVLSSEETNQATEAYLDLGLIYKTQGEDKEALLNFQKAFQLGPNNPKVLDSLIEMSIILKNKTLAQKILKNFKKVNSENEKIEEFERRIEEIKNQK